MDQMSMGRELTTRIPCVGDSIARFRIEPEPTGRLLAHAETKLRRHHLPPSASVDIVCLLNYFVATPVSSLLPLTCH